MADRVGQCFSDYRLIRFLGQGTFGEVYLGEHVRDTTQVAIKVLKTHLQDDKESVKKLKEFVNEASTFNLKHPHIVPLLAFGIGKDETPFLVFKYASHGSLRNRHPKGSRVPLPTIVSYVRQVASALQYAHDKRLIHRDVKPENILLGSENEILLSDFGTTTFAHDTASWEEQKMTGTLVYMAPEQILRKAQPASDQYSLGIMVYEWLCGMPPFSGEEFPLMYHHVEVPPPSLREKVPTVSPVVEQVVLRALAKDPKQRFASVQAFADALEQASQLELSTFVKPLPILPPPQYNPVAPPSPQSRSIALPWAATPPQYNPVTPPSPLPPIAHYGGGSPFPPAQAVPAPTTPLTTTTQPPVPPTRRISRRTVVIGLAGLAVAGGGIAWFATSHGLAPSGTTHTSTPQPIPSPTPAPSLTHTPSPTPPPIPAGTLLYTYRGHSLYVDAVAWSPDGTRIASGSDDKTVQVWGG